MINLKITLSGKVQGVGFRYDISQAAARLGLKGFVRNEPDGSVYLELEGPKNVLDEFIAWCKTGPRYAHVDKIETSQADIKKFDAFETM